MAELTVKYRLNADGLRVEDLLTERDFLAERLGIPGHLLQVLSWGHDSMVITYWILRDMLPLAELALCRETVQAELIKHGVEAVYLDSHPSEHVGQVRTFYGHDAYIVCNVNTVYSDRFPENCQTTKFIIPLLFPAIWYTPWLSFLFQCRWTRHSKLYIVSRHRILL